jgi:parallel beta-helix repeat protein
MTENIVTGPNGIRRRARVAAASALTLFVALVLTGLAGPAYAAASVLYVDGSNSSCSDTGAGTQATPYCTIVKAAVVAVGGQTVQVAAGTYTGTASLGHSGAAGAPIVFQAAPGVTISGGSKGFSLSSRSHVVIRGFTITGTSSYGVYLFAASDVRVEASHISFAGQPVDGSTHAGVYVNSSTDVHVVGNVVDHNTDSGIVVTADSTQVEVRGNTAYSNARQYTRAAAGIDVRGGSGVTVAGNVSHHNEDSGLNLTSTQGDVVTGNVLYNNGDHGIDDRDSPNDVITGNTVYGNVTAGINLEGTSGSTGCTVANNVSVNNGINSPRTSSNIRVDTLSAPGTTIDYDLVHLTSGTIQLIWGTTGYTSMSAFRLAHPGQEGHGLQGDPRFRGSADFHLLAGSPAIDSANSAAPGQLNPDGFGTARVNDPATPDTGAGPRTYDDRGAYEYQP